MIKSKSLFLFRDIFQPLVFLTLICLSTDVMAGSNTKILLRELETTLEKRSEYQQEKISRIEILRQEHQKVKNSSNNELEFFLCHKLYQEYESFIYDSAFKYVHEMIDLARELRRPDLLAQSKIELGFTFLSSGLFKEALDTLLNLNPKKFEQSLQIDYYTVLARTYYDLGDYHSDAYYSGLYTRQGNEILDLAINLLSDTSAHYWLALGLKEMKSNDFPNAADAFSFVLSQFDISEHDYAISTSSLGWVYTQLGRDQDAVDMLIKAAIADVQSSTKETVALRNIAIHMYRTGDLEIAYQYIKYALDDATFYNARHRKMEISEVLPIIEGKRLAALEKKGEQLLKYGLVTTILGVLLTIFAVIIFKQLTKLKAIRKILQETNANLKSMNDTLLETNKIKEEYIGYFFNINSEFINRLESFQKTIRRKITTRQYDDLNDVIKSSDLNKERENLFKNFDRIFIKLFPHFIEEFNKLFKPEDQIVEEHDGLLNADLRIFALIRLGISDNEKIASFLNYSVNTIYTYKTKLKHKAILSREEFDEYIMNIKAL